MTGGSDGSPNPFVEILQGNVVIAGIGNPLRGDDGLGCYLVNRLQGQVKALCIDTGSTPENYVGKILQAQPDTLLFIDAVHLNRSPGTWAIMHPAELAPDFPTTHGFSLRMLIEQLSTSIPAKIVFLAIQPRTLRIGDTLSGVIKKTLQCLEEWIVEAVNANTQEGRKEGAIP